MMARLMLFVVGMIACAGCVRAPGIAVDGTGQVWLTKESEVYRCSQGSGSGANTLACTQMSVGGFGK